MANLTAKEWRVLGKQDAEAGADVLSVAEDIRVNAGTTAETQYLQGAGITKASYAGFAQKAARDARTGREDEGSLR
jgi:hypothetical protein